MNDIPANQPDEVATTPADPRFDTVRAGILRPSCAAHPALDSIERDYEAMHDGNALIVHAKRFWQAKYEAEKPARITAEARVAELTAENTAKDEVVEAAKEWSAAEDEQLSKLGTSFGLAARNRFMNAQAALTAAITRLEANTDEG